MKYDESEIKSDQFVMTMDVYYDGVQLYSHKTEGHTGKKGDNDHFWCLAIRSSELGEGDEKKDNRKLMEINGTIEKKDNPKLISIMKTALEKAVIPNNKIKVDSFGNTKIIVSFGGIYEND